MAWAMSSLPVPVSPNRSTVESLGATSSTSCSTSRRAGLCPTIPAKSSSGRISSSEESPLFVLLDSSPANREHPSCIAEPSTFIEFMTTLPKLQVLADELYFVLPQLTLFSFCHNPFADIRRAILQLSAMRFAICQELHSAFIYESYIF